MALVLDGSAGVSGVDGTASNPAIEGTDSNTGIFYPAADTVAIGTGGTEALRVNSSQQLGLGVTSPAAKLDLNTGGASNTMARFTSNGSYYSYILSSNVTSVLSSDTSGNTGYAIRGGSNQLEMYTNGSERMRIDSSGNVGIGTGSPACRADVNGVIRAQGSTISASGEGLELIYTPNTPWISSNQAVVQAYNRTGSAYTPISLSGSLVAFVTGGTERARITSDGNLLVGTTSGSFRFVAVSSASDYISRIQNTASSTPQGLSIYYSGASPNGTGSPFLFCEDQSVLRMSVRSNGGLANYSANNVNLSDRREKTNFAPAKSYLDVICAIPVQTFNYIDQNMEEDPGETLGVVAQDVQAVAPEMVMESNWGTKEEPKMRLSIYQTDLQYALMKSIQELKAIVDAQAAEIAALKGNA